MPPTLLLIRDKQGWYHGEHMAVCWSQPTGKGHEVSDLSGKKKKRKEKGKENTHILWS